LHRTLFREYVHGRIRRTPILEGEAGFSCLGFTMICPKCQTEVPEEAKFCLECGHGLKADRFVPQPHPAPEPERKRVTALFSDLTNYTAITEKLDPEKVKEITAAVFAGIKQISAKYEGFIDRLLGDGVLVLFGVPKAHEDDAVRAVRAAKEIHEFIKELSPRYEARIGAPLSMHSGINTGLVVTAEVDPEKGSQGVAGDAVNLAARLSGLAGPGEILAGEETVRRTRGRFEFLDLGTKRVKGKAEPVPVFKVAYAKRALPVPDRQVSSVMVGRDRELNQLELQVMKVINGEGSVVNVVGEAGIGKSRLLADLRHREVMKKVTLLKGGAISIGRNLSFHPLIDLLKQWAGISEEDAEAAAFDKLELTIRALHPEEADEILSFVTTLMGMNLKGKYAERVQGIEGEALEKLIFKNIRELLIKGSERTPTVIVMEDLHWADRSSLLLLQSLYRLAEKHRILFVNLFRPGYWQGADQSMDEIGELLPNHYIELNIQPLDQQAGDALIRNLLDIQGLPYTLRLQIIERSGGNPFFIEEVVRSLIDEGAIIRVGGSFEVTEKINTVVVPPTINDVLIARIDRLEERTRDLVKIASVIGRNFFDRILKEVASSIEDIDNKLAYLKNLQLIRDRIQMNELEYLFKHALAQEAVYESTLLQQRKQLHLKVAEAIERLFSERLHEFYGILALHYSRADNLEKAEEYIVKAGEEALRSSASSEAITYFLQALQFYTEKHGLSADLEKLAGLEKNIALAYNSRGQFRESVHYIDKVFKRWGRRSPGNRVSRMVKFAIDLLIILMRLYLPWTGRKKIANKRVNEFFDLAKMKARAMLFFDQETMVTDIIVLIRESFRYDPAYLDFAAQSHLSLGMIFAGAGWFRLMDRVLDVAPQVVKETNIGDLPFNQTAISTINCFSGKWAEMPEYDKLILKAGAEKGAFWDMGAFLLDHGALKVYQGKFSQARELLDDFIFLEEKYGYGPISTKYLLHIELLIVCRLLFQAQDSANDLISFSVKMGQIDDFPGYGWRAVAQVLMKDITGARDSLEHAEQCRHRQSFWMPWYLSSSLLGEFMLDLHFLEDAIGDGPRSLIPKQAEAARKSGRRAVRNAVKYAPRRTENYRLMGEYYWLVGKQRKAFQWFDKSIQEGERLGARPDLARTYMEVGKRLLEPHSKCKELDGLSAKEYLEKAEKLFREMDLQWDLEQLERVRLEL